MVKNSYAAQRLTRWEKYRKALLPLDIYRQQLKFQLPDGKNEYRSFVGSVLTLLTFINLLSFIVYKLLALVSFSEYTFQHHTQENYFDSEDIFKASDSNFMVAAGITAYDGSSEIITDPSIGELKFYKKGWSGAETPSGLFQPIATKTCAQSIFYHSDDIENTGDTRFYLTSQNSLVDLQIYGPKLQCLEKPKDVVLWGNYDSSEASNLMVVFEKCDPNDATRMCKSEEEISAWMLEKYIIVFTNQKKFISYEFGQKGIEKSAQLTWYPLNTDSRLDFVTHIYRSSIERRENLLYDLGALTENLETGFSIEKESIRSMQYKNSFQIAVTFEMSFRQNYFYRRTANLIDICAFIGGLFGLLSGLSSVIVYVLQHNGVYWFLLSDLFLGPKPLKSSETDKDDLGSQQNLSLSFRSEIQNDE